MLKDEIIMIVHKKFVSMIDLQFTIKNYVKLTKSFVFELDFFRYSGLSKII